MRLQACAIALLNIEPLAADVCARNIWKSPSNLWCLPQQSEAHVIQYLARLWYNEEPKVLGVPALSKLDVPEPSQRCSVVYVHLRWH
jgi:hypothetical protein